MNEDKLQSEESLDFISLENFQKISAIVFGNLDLKEIESIDIKAIGVFYRKSFSILLDLS